MLKFPSLTLLTIFLIGGCADDPATPEDLETIERLPLIGDAVFPEGVAVHQGTSEVFVSSPARGQIQRLAGGQAEVFIDAADDPSLLGSFVGMTVDEPRDRLIVANVGGFESIPRSQIAVFDTREGSLIEAIEVPAENEGEVHLTNDIAVTSDGTIYATDSFANVIWRVSSDLSQISLFAAADNFATVTPTEEGVIGLNGIVVAPDGRHLVATMTFDPHLYGVALDTGEVFEIDVDGGYPVDGGDGLAFVDASRMLVLQNTGNTIFTLEVDLDDRSGRLLADSAPPRVQDLLRGPTTGEILASTGTYYIANGQFTAMQDQDPELPFEVLAVPVSLFDAE